MKSITSEELAKLLGGELVGSGSILLNGVNSLSDAKSDDLSFLNNQKYVAQVATTKSEVIIIPKNIDAQLPQNKVWIKCDSPNIAFSKAVNFFAPPAPEYKAGIHPSAVVSPTAKIDPSCYIGPCVVVEDSAEIGADSKILAGSFIGEYTKIGKKCLIYQSVVIRERAIIGNGVIIHPNVTIGADGFGYEAGPLGIMKIPQVGIVQIDDDVEIGANSAIDRARFGKTWIKMGVKIDNLVQVAHNVTVGEFSMLIAQCGLAGSSKIGQGVVIAAQAGINHHTSIGDGAKVAGTAGVTKDVPPMGIYVGTPAEPVREFTERIMLPKNVRKLKDKVKELEARLAKLEGK